MLVSRDAGCKRLGPEHSGNLGAQSAGQNNLMVLDAVVEGELGDGVRMFHNGTIPNQISPLQHCIFRDIVPNLGFLLDGVGAFCLIVEAEMDFTVPRQPPPGSVVLVHKRLGWRDNGKVATCITFDKVGRNPNAANGLSRLVKPEDVLDDGLRHDGDVGVIVVIAVPRLVNMMPAKHEKRP